jgi:hypothetical protein
VAEIAQVNGISARLAEVIFQYLQRGAELRIQKAENRIQEAQDGGIDPGDSR